MTEEAGLPVSMTRQSRLLSEISWCWADCWHSAPITYLYLPATRTGAPGPNYTGHHPGAQQPPVLLNWILHFHCGLSPHFCPFGSPGMSECAALRRGLWLVSRDVVSLVNMLRGQRQCRLLTVIVIQIQCLQVKMKHCGHCPGLGSPPPGDGWEHSSAQGPGFTHPTNTNTELLLSIHQRTLTLATDSISITHDMLPFGCSCCLE